jgi:hypothetical protein
MQSWRKGMDSLKAAAALGYLIFMMTFSESLCLAAGQNQTAAPAPQALSGMPAIEQLRAEISQIKVQYEERIKQLEVRLEDLQTQMLRNAPETEAPAAAAAPILAPQTTAGAFNPAIAVVGNLVARADSQKVFNDAGQRIDNKILLREGEIDLRVPVDPYADGVLITSLESETPNEFSVGIEEGYVNIKKLPFLDRPPLGLKIKAGRFRPLFGNINALHTHDLPQTFRPLPIQEFLGSEGFNEDGVSANIFLPTPGENTNLDFTFDVLTGGDIAVSPNPNSRMAYLGHLRYYQTFKDSHNLQLGWSSYFHPKGNGIGQADIHDFDFMYRWKPNRRGEWTSLLLGGELMFGRRAYPEAYEMPDVARALEGRQPGTGKPLGYYVFTQWQFNRRMYAGVRWDKTDVLFDPALKRRSLTPFASYYFSEFLRFRLNYEHRWSDLFTENGRNSVYAELNFVFGSHPTEPFWVNK